LERQLGLVFDRLEQMIQAALERRVEFLLELIGYWIPDDPATLEEKSLLPEWVRWLGER
jgi:hypothetical protein